MLYSADGLLRIYSTSFPLAEAFEHVLELLHKPSQSLLTRYSIFIQSSFHFNRFSRRYFQNYSRRDNLTSHAIRAINTKKIIIFKYRLAKK